ncbi:MAG: hypothetical protein ACFFAU_13035 [Candidatus Hodarchaeota archaeon]
MLDSISELEEVLLSLPPSPQAIYRVLLGGNPMTLAVIRKSTLYSSRTVQEAVRFLERQKLIVKFPNYRDMSRCYFQASPL